MGIDYFNFYELNSLQILLTLHKKNIHLKNLTFTNLIFFILF